MPPRRNSSGQLVFADHPEFRPNLTPRQIFAAGAFGGTYWRPIHSRVTGKDHKNVHKKYPASWWKGIPGGDPTRDYRDYDKSINKYGVKVGTTLRFWEDSGWITKHHPYGWVHWYCDFYLGKRTPDDDRQIKRWLGICGEGGRFRNRLISMLAKKGARADDPTVSPKIRQTLLHWAYELTPKEYAAGKRQLRSR